MQVPKVTDKTHLYQGWWRQVLKAKRDTTVCESDLKKSESSLFCHAGCFQPTGPPLRTSRLNNSTFLVVDVGTQPNSLPDVAASLTAATHSAMRSE